MEGPGLSWQQRPEGGLARASRRLVEWFDERARDLPWRSADRDPYRVLVSELMLQQTQVDRVVPRFEAFIARFPTLADLAAAAEEEVLDAWSGLGYYRRARMLHRAAQVVAERDGKLPRTVAELVQLPGVGPYTAAAVASLAFGQAEPVLDGNTMRAGARVLALEQPPRTGEGGREIRGWIARLMRDRPPGKVNEALMELGAVVCRPRGPDCPACPLSEICRARALGRQHDYPRAPARTGRPVEEQRWAAACGVDRQGRWLLRRIDEGPILRGLWLPPLVRVGPDDEVIEAARRQAPELLGDRASVLPPVRHSITFRRLTVTPVRFAAPPAPLPDDGWVRARPDGLDRPTSSLLGKLVAQVGRSEET